MQGEGGIIQTNISRDMTAQHKTQLCSEPDCFKEVDLEHDALQKPDGTYYAPSLKCWGCRTKNDRKNIKAHRRRYNKSAYNSLAPAA